MSSSPPSRRARCRVTKALPGSLLSLVVLSIASPAYGEGFLQYFQFAGEVQTEEGVVDFVTLVGFNPQPEPPPLTDLADPTAPVIGWTNPMDTYEVIIGTAILGPGDWELSYDTSGQALPDAQGMYQFGGDANEVSGIQPTPFLFDVIFEVNVTAGTFDRLSWAGFNPQPEPPPLGFDALVGFGFDVIPASPTAVTLGVSIRDQSTGNLATLQLINDLGQAGDYNQDGYVGVEDLDLLLARWGDTAGPGVLTPGDGNGDGVVGADDLTLVQANWGNGTPPGGTVPEPGTLAGFTLGGWLLLRRRRA